LTKSDKDETSSDNHITPHCPAGISVRPGLHDHKHMAAGKGEYAHAVQVTDT